MNLFSVEDDFDVLISRMRPVDVVYELTEGDGLAASQIAIYVYEV